MSFRRPPYVLQPGSWTKVLPPHFLAARQTALLRAQEYERQMGISSHHRPISRDPMNAASGVHVGPHSHPHSMGMPEQPHPHYGDAQHQQAIPYYGDARMAAYPQSGNPLQPLPAYNYPHMVNADPPVAPPDAPVYTTEDAPMDEAMVAKASPPLRSSAMDPPDEPPSLSKRTNSPGNVYEDGQGESYEESDFYSAKDPDYYRHSHSEGNVYSENANSESMRSAYNSHMMPGEESQMPPYQYDKPKGGESGQMYHEYGASDQVGNGHELGESFQYYHSDIHAETEDASYGDDVDENRHEKAQLPLTSPSSNHGSEAVSHTSNAMRGAQELLKRNRQKRLEMSARREGNSMNVDTEGQDSDLDRDKDVASPTSPQSGSTWESSSEVTSVVSGTSSAWTEGSNNDRSSRRALILQMAKARMRKNNPTKTVGSKNASVIAEDEEEKKLDSGGEEGLMNTGIPRINSLNESGTDIDISQDLD